MRRGLERGGVLGEDRRRAAGFRDHGHFTGGEDGLRIVRDIRRSLFTCDVLVLSDACETLYAMDALRSGANGYLMKADAATNIARAIQRVIDHKVYLSDYMWNLLWNLSEEPLPAAAAKKMSGLGLTHRRIFHLLSAVPFDPDLPVSGIGNADVIVMLRTRRKRSGSRHRTPCGLLPDFAQI